MSSTEKLLLRTLRGETTERIPFWLMRQAGRYLPEYRALRAEAGSFLDLCFDPIKATEVTLQPIRRFGMDAAILFSDILVVPLGLGQEVGFQEGEGPKLDPIRDASALHKLSKDIDLSRLAPIYETVERVKESLPAETALIGFAGAPWTVATYVVEGGSSRRFDQVKSWAASDPASFQILIDRLTQATIAHLAAQIEAGVEVVQLFDSWAGALQGDPFERWVVRPNQTIVRAIKARWPDLPVIGFPKGAAAGYARYAEATGVDAISIDPDYPLTEARDVLQPITAVQGNLDPQLLFDGGEPLVEAIARILDTLGQGRFVFNLGHGVMQGTPVEHVATLAEILRSSVKPSQIP
jgi:uroporphyrinogen decarboxylase